MGFIRVTRSVVFWRKHKSPASLTGAAFGFQSIQRLPSPSPGRTVLQSTTDGQKPGGTKALRKGAKTQRENYGRGKTERFGTKNEKTER
jgi:hypothetical protein